jgi:hypothetical protein
MTTLAPDRSLEQCMTALVIATEFRTKRAAFKRELKAGRAKPIPVIVDPPEWLRSAKVVTVLRALPAFGPVKTNAAMRACGISASKTIAGLSERQRAELIAHLRERAPEAKPRWTALREPQGTDPRTQHMQALALSNDIRLARAAIRRQVFAGERTVASVLREMPVCVESMTLFDLLACQHRWGVDRTRRLLVRLGIPEGKALGTLTQRQVGLVVDKLEEGGR